MKEYYQQRLYWIFHYSSKNVWYCVAKTLCLIIGVPIYAICFAVEMVLTAINMLFSWIPVLNVVVMVICKCLIIVFGSTFYLCVLPDWKLYKESTSTEVEYEVADADDVTGEDVAATPQYVDAPQDTDATDEHAVSDQQESKSDPENQ